MTRHPRLAQLLDARASLRTQLAQLSPGPCTKRNARTPKAPAPPPRRRSDPAPKPLGTGWPPGVWPAIPRLPDDCCPLARHLLDDPPMRAVRLREVLGLRIHLWLRWSDRARRVLGAFGEASALEARMLRDARRRMAIEDAFPRIASFPVHYHATGFGLDAPYARGLFLQPYLDRTRARVNRWARALAPMTAAAWDAEVGRGVP